MKKKLSKETYEEVMSLLDNEIGNNTGIGNRDRLEELYTIREEIEQLNN